MSALIYPLPNTTAIPDLQTGRQMLSLLSLANPQKAESEINQFLDSLLQSPPQAEVYLNLLEELREPLCFVEEELARHYINKPLPLDEIEEGCFRQVTATWLKMARAYAHCTRLDSAAIDAAHLLRRALTLQRSISYGGLAIVEHQRDEAIARCDDGCAFAQNLASLRGRRSDADIATHRQQPRAALPIFKHRARDRDHCADRNMIGVCNAVEPLDLLVIAKPQEIAFGQREQSVALAHGETDIVIRRQGGDGERHHPKCQQAGFQRRE